MIAEAGLGQVKVRQSVRRHRRHAFGLAALMEVISSFLRLIDAAACGHGATALAICASAGPVRAARLAIALERLGPAYIKLGQMLATRPDIVGEEVAPSLEHLQDRLPPFRKQRRAKSIVQSFRPAGRKPVLRFRPAGGGGVHRPGASRHHQRRRGCRGESAAARHRDAIRARSARAGAVRARGRAAFQPKRGGCASPRWSRPWRPPWRWNWICAWKRRRRPSFTSAPAAMPNSACRMWTGRAPRPAC